MIEARLALPLIKLVHTTIWCFFVATIGAIWLFAWHSNFNDAAWAIAIVFVEVSVLAANHGQCPLGRAVARYTKDRRDNFDIYLPAWLAARTKSIFGTLYGGAIIFTVLRYSGLSLTGNSP